ncbi:multidrug effflux MFS transporter [Endozoicomonas arenosclerae]|uniref:multidrug effflux MFS transporter n=1 Tax=Endozoicomonas arenosclerae TaxID=1633495 RepID=UPI000783DE6C|nr:multidrug effflux MFS transporter [Endozoicomonas arenosclerae]
MSALNPEKHPIAVLVILTLFAVVGPVSIDIFSPSLPAITEFFGSNSATTQWSVGIFMLGFSLSMLIVGPLADRLGRKKTLMLGYTLYLVATAATLLTDNIYLFIAARFAQALFGCFGTAVARILARDYFQDKMEVRMLSYISACLTIAPMLAPIAGGFIQEYFGWQYNFIAMGSMAIVAMLGLMMIPEKHQASKKAGSPILSGYKDVLTDWRYLSFTLAAGAAFSGAFVFVAGGPFVMISQLGLAPKYYGFLFAAAIAGYLFSASFGPKLNDRLGRQKSTRLAWMALATGALVSFATAWWSQGNSILGYMIGIVIFELGLGLFMPLCQARATEHMTKNVGTAAGLIFFIEMLLATVVSGLVGSLPEMGTLTLASVTLLATLAAGLCIRNNTSKDLHATVQAA